QRSEQRFTSPIPQVGISREEFITLPDQNLGEILERLPGVVIGGPPGESKDVRLRGLDKEFTRTQVDGIQLPGGGEKREFQVNRLPSFIVEEVRIIRNPTAEFESDGIAGRIDVETRPIPEDPTFNLVARYGGLNSFDGDYLNGAIGYGDRVSETFGFNSYFDYKELPLDRDKEEVEFEDGSIKKKKIENEDISQELISAGGDIGFFYNQGEVHFKPLFLRLDERKEKLKLETETKKPDEIKREEENEDKIQETIGGTLEHQHTFASGFNLETKLAYFSTTEDKDKEKLKFKEGVLEKTELEKEEKEDEVIVFKTTGTLPIDAGLRQEIKFGAMVRLRDRFRDKTKTEFKVVNGLIDESTAKDKTTGKDNYEITEDYFAVFVQDEIFLSDQFSILPGLRLENVNRQAGRPNQEEVDRTITDLNPSLHLLYRPQSNLTLKAAVSKGVNRPKFDELSPFEEEKGDEIKIGSPNLNPARSWNYDIGVNYEVPALFLGANFFYKQIEGVIEEVDTGRDRDGKDIVQVSNAGDGYLQGLELEQRLNIGQLLKAKALEGLVIKANQTFIGSELEDNQGNLRPFKEQPDFIANIIAEYTYQPWGTTIALAWNHISERKEFKPDVIKTIEPSSTLDLVIRQQVKDNLSVSFSVENITDAKKEEREETFDGTLVKTKDEDFGQTFLLEVDWKF
ncbi:MAG: TonB-dependent receptor plug domain-containing protein, partial [Halothece sp.]